MKTAVVLLGVCMPVAMVLLAMRVIMGEAAKVHSFDPYRFPTFTLDTTERLSA